MRGSGALAMRIHIRLVGETPNLGARLQTLTGAGLVRCLAYFEKLSRRPTPHNHQPGGDPDARLQLDGFDNEAADGGDRAEGRPDRPLSVVLMRCG
jgi:hypothetical protein